MKLLVGFLLLGWVQTGNASGLDLACNGYRPMLSNDEVKRPEPPFCASTGFEFADEYDFERCRSEMERYRGKISGYAECLASEQEQAVEQFNDSVESFNRKASN